MSNIVGRMKVSFKKSKINKMVRGVFKDYESLVHSSSRIYFKVNIEKWVRRESRRYFCSDAKVITLPSDQIKIGGIVCSLYKSITRQKDTEVSIANKDLNKTINAYSSSVNLVDKLSLFSMHKCNKYINLTKEFLCDPVFLKFALYLLKNSNRVQVELDCINDE